MATYTIENVTATADTLDEAKRAAARGYLIHIGGTEPTEQEIDALLAELEATEMATTLAELAKIDFRALPDWATWTPEQAAETLRTAILNGMTKAEARAAIDAQFAGVTNLAQLGAATVVILKTLADAVIDGRDKGHVNEARALMWLRDISVR